MTYDEWSRENKAAIVTRWRQWCDHAFKFHQFYPKDYVFPVPKVYLEHYKTGNDPDGLRVDAYMRMKFDAGTPVEMPRDVPSPPAASFIGRAYQNGQDSQTAAEAAWRGAKEGFKSQAGNSARTILGLLFKR